MDRIEDIRTRIEIIRRLLYMDGIFLLSEVDRLTAELARAKTALKKCDSEGTHFWASAYWSKEE